MPKDGSRVGAGRPKNRAVGSSPGSTKPLGPPTTLTDAERAAWLQWAPLACRMQTLTEETVPGFVLLCTVATEVDALRAAIARDGWQPAPGMAHALSATYRQHLLRYEQLLARFGLAAAGRAVDVPKPEKPDDLSKWERLTRRPDQSNDEDASDFYDTLLPGRRAN